MASSRNSRSTDDPGGVLAASLDAHVAPGARVCVALSGGVDSVLLLHLLAEAAPARSLSLCACHVHHGLSPRADDWAAFCARQCEDLGVPLTVMRVAVPADDAAGLEGAARQRRYAALAQAARDANAAWVVTAHHRDDQAETLLLNLLRGAGVHGAAAMPAVRPLDSMRLLRPLLAVPRARLLDEARARSLAWVDDESNANTALGRNFLRHHVLPTLEARWPGSTGSLARAADHFAEAAQLLDALACSDLAAAPPAAVPGAPHALALSVLEGLDEARAGNLLRYWLRGAGVAVPPAVRLHEWLRQLRDGGTAPEMHLPGWLALRYRDTLVLLPDDDGPHGAQLWHGEASLSWGRGEVCFVSAPGAGLRLAGVAVELRGRQPGDRFRPHPGAPSRSLKNLLQEAGVPPALRRRLPLLACGSEVLWLPFVGVSAVYAAAAGEPGVMPRWQFRACG